MIRLRRHRCLGSAVAALFALCVVAPRRALLFHHHAGGEHRHAHGDGDADWMATFFAELREHHHHHHHPHHGSSDQRLDHRHPVTPDGPALRVAEAGKKGHWHEQQRFQRAVASSIAYAIAAAPVTAAPEPAPLARARVAALDLRARAPPSPALSA
jgi:hypothetical protein